MIADLLYVDASAAVKLFVDEPGSDLVAAAFDDAAALVSNRLLSTEVRAALHRRVPPDRLPEAERVWAETWAGHQIVEIDQRLADHALSLAVFHGLGTLDAIHLASVLRIPAVPLKFATWDRTLWDAAQAVGLRTVPDARP